MTAPTPRPAARQAGPELLDHCARWPRSARFSLTVRVEGVALDVLERLVVARYQPRQRAATLRDANLLLERMRFLCRIAHTRSFMSSRAFDKAMRDVDEAGRMIYGWRQRLRSNGRERPREPFAGPAEQTHQ